MSLALSGSELQGVFWRKGGKELVDCLDQGINGAMQAVGGDAILESPPDLLHRVLLVPAVGWQGEQLHLGMLQVAIWGTV